MPVSLQNTYVGVVDVWRWVFGEVIGIRLDHEDGDFMMS